MKYTWQLSTGLILLAAGSACDATSTTASSDDLRFATSRYHVFALRALGGVDSAGNGINDLGSITGYSNLPDNASRHATQWRLGAVRDLGTLGGPNSSVVWPVKNLRGVITGIAETGAIDPNGEAWSCAAFFPSVTGHVCRGFRWERGAMHALPTLGGTHGFATGSDNRGRIVGWAENTVRDASCVPPQVLQFRATLWDADDRAHELPPLPGDSASAATGINDRGQVIGISGRCDRAVGRFSAAHAVLWEGDRAIDLGDLGGEAWNTAMAISQRGDVVGFANVPTDPPTAPGSFAAHGFSWTPEDGIEELAPLDGDVYSQALSINERRQVVGQSCSAGFAACRAVIWQHGAIVDLNTLVTTSHLGPLVFAGDINDWGWITGQALDPASGALVAFVAVPGFGSDAAPPPAEAPPVLTERARQAMFQHLRLPADLELAH